MYMIRLTDKFKGKEIAEDIIKMLVKDGWNKDWFEIVELPEKDD